MEGAGNFLEEVFPPPPNLPLSSRTFPKTPHWHVVGIFDKGKGEAVLGKDFLFSGGVFSGCGFAPFGGMESRQNLHTSF